MIVCGRSSLASMRPNLASTGSTDASGGMETRRTSALGERFGNARIGLVGTEDESLDAARRFARPCRGCARCRRPSRIFAMAGDEILRAIAKAEGEEVHARRSPAAARALHSPRRARGPFGFHLRIRLVMPARRKFRDARRREPAERPDRHAAHERRRIVEPRFDERRERRIAANCPRRSEHCA